MIDEHRSAAVAPPGAGESVYVYAVARPRDGLLRSALTGVGEHPAPVRPVVRPPLAALVSDVPKEWHAARRADLEAHDRVLSELTDETIVPMRFGVVMRDDDEVRELLLQRHESELTQLLDHVEDRVQMSVKAYYHGEALLRAVLQRRPDLKQRSDALEGRPVAISQNERIALGREVAAAVEEQRALDEHLIVTPLARIAADARVDPGRSERHAFTVQLLVDAARRPELDAAVQQVTAEHGGRFAFRYVGPLPPYSFTDLALAVGDARWG